VTSLLVTVLSTIVIISNIPGVQPRELPPVKRDHIYDCRARAAAKECLPDGPDPTMMKRTCATTCKRWLEDLGHSTQFQLDDHEVFYDMTAVSAFNDKVVEFDRFDGYLTVIVPVAKTCSDSPVSAKAIFESIASLKDAFKYNVEVIIFPYLHPTMNYDKDGLDCSEFEELMAVDQKKSKYFVMKETNMDTTNGDTHPVFELFFNAMKKDLKEEQEKTKDYDAEEGESRHGKAKRRGEDVPDEFTIPPLYDFFFDTTEVEDLIFKTQTYFVVEPDGNTVYLHYDKSLVDIKDALRELTKILGEIKEEL